METAAGYSRGQGKNRPDGLAPGRSDTVPAITTAQFSP